MGARMPPAQILAPTASAGTIYSSKIDLQGCPFASIQYFSTGTVTGTWAVQASNKLNPNETTDTDWSSPTLVTALTQPAGSASNFLVDLSGGAANGAKWVRMKYVHTSGSGNVEAWAMGKGT